MRFLVVLSLLISSTAFSKAPPSSSYQDSKAVFIDIQRIYMNLEINVAARTGKVHGHFVFLSDESGYPIFDLVPSLSKIDLNGSPTTQTLISDPDGETKMRVVGSKVVAGSINAIGFEYNYPVSEMSFANGGVSTLWSTSDLGSGRQFMEQYFPTNFEYDQFGLEMHLKVVGSARHEIFTNASAMELGRNEWNLSFPSWYNSSSHYLHLTTKGRFQVARGEFTSRTGQVIPLVLYGSSPSQALTKTKQVLAENENTFGPYAHSGFVGYMTTSGGGMEHCGGAITSYGALAHEITHSWFARGVMPADGNSGWLDEAAASWRDNGYPRAGTPNRSPVNLSGHSPYRRQTDEGSYGSGSRFLSELDFVFKDMGGMRKQLSDFYSLRKQTTMQTVEFKDFLEANTSKSLKAWFDRYVYGKGNVGETPVSDVGTGHPRPFTREERNKLR